MSRFERFLCRVSFPLVGLIFLAAGCNQGGPKQAEPNAEKTHIQKANAFVTEYLGTHGKKLPKSMEEIQAWAVKERKAEADDFVSTRDGELYVLAGGRVAEKTGQDGRVYVAFMGGATETTVENVEQMKNDAAQSGPPRQRR
jgi:hypothetical protein